MSIPTRPDMHWQPLNLLATSGVAFMTAGLLVFLWNFFESKAHGELAGANPWGAGSLEWAVASPPPCYNFAEVLTVNGREALWTAKPDQPVVTGLREDIRELLVTNSLDAEPDHRELSEGSSIWPFLTSITVSAAFVGSIFSPWAVPIGAVPVTISLIGWLWPKSHHGSPLFGNNEELLG